MRYNEGTHTYFEHKEPRLKIEHGGGAMLGNCYSSTSYKVSSTTRLSRDQLEALWKSGIIIHGQEFRIHSQCDGKEEPHHHVECEAVERDARTGKEISRSKTYKAAYGNGVFTPRPQGIYVYEVSVLVDSSD